MGQHKALREEDIEEYKAIGIMKENDITIERVIGKKLDKVDDLTMFSDLGQPSEQFEQVDISDLWVENEKEMKRKVNQMHNHGDPNVKEEAEKTQVVVDKKLEEFLSAHSAYLTPVIANFLRKRKQGTLGTREMIIDLSIIAYERNKFIKSL